MENFKIKCIKSCSSNFTEGKIYEVKNGAIINNNGISSYNHFDSVEKINIFLASKFELYEPPYLKDPIYYIPNADCGKGGYTWPTSGMYENVTLFDEYCKRDNYVDAFKYGLNVLYVIPLSVVKVIFNNPATIVMWSDGTKTVVKAQDGDTFDPEKGLAMAMSKKALGNKGNYYDEFKKWLPKEEEEV